MWHFAPACIGGIGDELAFAYDARDDSRLQEACRELRRDEGDRRRRGSRTSTGLVQRHRPGGPLERAFYTAPEVFEADLRHIFYRHWLFAGHACAIPQRRRLLHLAGRRRRSSSSCAARTARSAPSTISAAIAAPASATTSTGTRRKLVCPYHRWTYDLDGQPDHRDPARVRCRPSRRSASCRCALHNVAGLIFVNFADDPPGFLGRDRDHRAADGAARAREVQGRAQSVDYVVKANWKIVFENNRECYHCPSHHDDYNAATYDVMRDRALFEPKLQAASSTRSRTRPMPASARSA